MTADLHPDTGLPRPGTCCGVCPPIAGGGWDCTCPGLPGCPAADRPSVTDNARAEAIEAAARWLDRIYPNGLVAKKSVLADLAEWADRAKRGVHPSGREWAAGRAETTDEEVAAYAEGRAEALDLIRREWCPCVDGQPQDCKPEDWPTSRRHGYPARLRDALAAGRAETTTDEDAGRSREEIAGAIQAHLEADPTGLTAADMVLATARTRPTDPTDAQVLAALNAMHPRAAAPSLDYWGGKADEMRTALRAAWTEADQ